MVESVPDDHDASDDGISSRVCPPPLPHPTVVKISDDYSEIGSTTVPSVRRVLDIVTWDDGVEGKGSNDVMHAAWE